MEIGGPGPNVLDAVLVLLLVLAVSAAGGRARCRRWPRSWASRSGSWRACGLRR